MDINPQELFRMPWSMADNGITWLEPTRHCNITCDACFHFNDPSSAKSFSQIEEELTTMLRLRKCDSMLIAGGEPLTHPGIVEITKMVKAHKVKPVLLTNGVALDDHLVRELKKAGLFAVVFHVDAHQSRPDWTGKSETELNELRRHYADMIHRAGGLACGFILTVFPDTLNDMPFVMEWAARNADKVNLITFSLVRLINENDPWDFYAGAQKISIGQTPYASPVSYKNLLTVDMYKEIKKAIPEFTFNSYLGGTVLSDSLKWTLGNYISSKKRTYGCTGARSMELIQNVHHFFKGRYLSYTKPALARKAKAMLFFSLFDRAMRKTIKNYFRSVIRNPLRIFEKLYVQSVSVVQPVDILPNGENDNCDGCPNKTYWNGRLVSACRLEEFMIYGAPLSVLKKTAS